MCLLWYYAGIESGGYCFRQCVHASCTVAHLRLFTPPYFSLWCFQEVWWCLSPKPAPQLEQCSAQWEGRRGLNLILCLQQLFQEDTLNELTPRHVGFLLSEEQDVQNNFLEVLTSSAVLCLAGCRFYGWPSGWNIVRGGLCLLTSQHSLWGPLHLQSCLLPSHAEHLEVQLCVLISWRLPGPHSTMSPAANTFTLSLTQHSE